MLAQQHRCHARAVDEEIALELAAVRGAQRSNIAVRLAVDLRDVIQDVPHTQFLGAVPVKQFREFSGIEVVGVVDDRRILGRRFLLRRKVPVADPALGAHRIDERNRVLPCLPERNEVEARIARRHRERVVVSIVGLARDPAHELRALLEGGRTLGQELGFRQTDLLQRRAHRRPGPFADADGLHVRRFDQRDTDVPAGARDVLARQQPGGQPAGAAAADDHDALDPVIHVRGHQRKKSRCRAAALI